MRYYVKYSETGEIEGYMEYPYANETMTEVTKKEYYALRGEEVPPEPLTETELFKQNISVLQLAVAELAETAEAQDIANKLAIAELAEATMGGES